MATQAIAVRYAKALFDVASGENEAPAVEQELAGFVDLMVSHDELGQVLVNPAVPVSKKRAIVEALLARIPSRPVLARLLDLLASRDRLEVLPGMLADFRRRLQDREGVIRGEVTTAVPLSAERLEVIEQSLGGVTGRRVILSAKVDPEIVGGMSARVGGTVYDGSLATQLRRMKESLGGRSVRS